MRLRADLTDAVLLAGLGTLALLGLHNTYAGWSFLVVGAVGLGAGLVMSWLLTALRQPVIVVAAVVALVFFGLGGVLVLPDQSPFSVDTLRTLSVASVFGWKQLLTTLPPVDGDGPLLVVPYVLGLLCGSAGTLAAQRIGAPRRPGGRRALVRAAAAVPVPALVLGAVIVFGTREPAAQLLDGVAFAVLTLCWTALRLHRHRPPVRQGSRRLTRALSGAAVLALASATAAFVGPSLPGAAADRSVLRDHIVPPFDLGAYPSPLVGFRKYTKDANQLWDQTLFTVTGLPDGATVRIATLDDYDGSVWGATSGSGSGSFQRVGARFGSAGTASQTTVRVTIGAAYASAGDVNPWLPDTGTVTGIDFGGDRRRILAESFRFNLAASSGIVTARLASGDSYTLRTVLGAPKLPDNAQPYGRPGLTESAQALLSSKVAAWTKGASGLSAQLRAVASYLHNTGAYTDGGPGETQYLPGHSTGRLGAFLNATRPAGDDEQYAAAYALAANYLGIPARVVLGARPEVGGVVRGGDVHAWVEVHLADGRWAPIPQTEFMPDTSKRPDQQPPQEVENANAAVVPPPNAVRLPTSTVDTSRTDPNQNPQKPRPRSWWDVIWPYLQPVVVWGGPPVALLLLVCGAILGLKARRRHRRRTRGPTANRFAGGWRELVDRARDFGAVVPAGHTRQEEVEILALQEIRAFAAEADLIVYGPDDPSEPQVEAYWARIDLMRKEMGRGTGRWRRLRAALNVRSLRAPRSNP